MNQPLRVIKIGGSLFDLPDLPDRVRVWIDSQPKARNVMIAGGGALCNAIRQADQRFQLGETVAHWLCIRALATSAGLLAGLLQWEEIDSWNKLREMISKGEHEPIVFNPTPFLFSEESHRPGRVLPHGWQVTTDSIAARVAELLAADELVLLKSANADDISLEALAEAGYVDRYFPQVAEHVSRIRYVNLRNT